MLLNPSFLRLTRSSQSQSAARRYGPRWLWGPEPAAARVLRPP